VSTYSSRAATAHHTQLPAEPSAAVTANEYSPVALAITELLALREAVTLLV